MKTITVDHEHNCETWWDAAREAAKDGNNPPSCIGLINEVNTITVDDQDADEFLEWAGGLPGWNEEPFVVSKAN